MVEAAQDKITLEVAVNMVLMLLVVLLAVVLVLFWDPPLSQSMNHTSFPQANHKHGIFLSSCPTDQKNIQ